jgi:hypothetical protein
MPNYQSCYTIPYPIEEPIQLPNGQTIYLELGSSNYTTCGEINESAQQCVSSCASEYTEAYDQYFAEDCPPVSEP